MILNTKMLEKANQMIRTCEDAAFGVVDEKVYDIAHITWLGDEGSEFVVWQNFTKTADTMYGVPAYISIVCRDAIYRVRS